MHLLATIITLRMTYLVYNVKSLESFLAIYLPGETHVSPDWPPGVLSSYNAAVRR